MISTSAGSPRSRRTRIALTVVPIDGPYAVSTLLPVKRSNSGTSVLKAAVKPPEIITLTSAAPAAPANSSALATPSTAARKFADFNLTIDRSSRGDS
jgi:hypothetical protein